ncbi:hypothetical protein N7449_008885 [Penicillium cf. viridicatum]|uniref:Cytochrome P450 n=1 Tax=Penicillium cf. viridicatum TaxID=2972119 RepID=A0A9W9M8I3_9EURO|nr:hypothetical protein N7449_008885 [Penicillium cf. viridicatum]
MLPVTALVGEAIAVLLLSRVLRIGRRPKNYPPGPPTLPSLGNIHQMPSQDAHLQFEKWAREYGPIYSLILGTKCLIILSSDEAVKELLDKRSGTYSHRPGLYIGQILCSGDLRMLMMFRKMVHGLTLRHPRISTLPNVGEPTNVVSVPDGARRISEAHSTILQCPHDDDGFRMGWRTLTYEDEKMMQLFNGFSEFADLNQTGTAAMIDFFPWLRKLPEFLLPAQQKAKDLHKKEKALYLSHWLRAKEEVQQNTIKPCFSAGMYKAQKEDGFSDDQAAYISGTLLEADSDTTSSTLYAFVQAMLLYPDVQRKARKEIERAVGSGRLPVMEDLSELQCVRGCMPTTILGAVPHAVTQDDEYKGPRVFNPDRYHDDYQSFGEAAANADPLKRDVFTFGAGRRICPGIHVAERSLFLGMSRILWAFDITPETDTAGTPILPDPDRLTQGFVCMPEEFPVKITPRSQERADLVMSEWKEAEKECLDPKIRPWMQSPVEV